MKKKIARSFRFMGTAVKELFGSSESVRNASTIFLIQFSLFFLCYPLSFRADDGPMNAVRLVMIALIGIALPYIGVHRAGEVRRGVRKKVRGRVPVFPGDCSDPQRAGIPAPADLPVWI